VLNLLQLINQNMFVLLKNVFFYHVDNRCSLDLTIILAPTSRKVDSATYAERGPEIVDRILLAVFVGL
jgi:hypothetical protein